MASIFCLTSIFVRFYLLNFTIKEYYSFKWKQLEEYMKKFTRILMCLLLCVFTFGLVACGRTTDNFVYPNSSSETFGNGGMAVQKGDYLYFVNGYLSADSQTEKNASYTVGALMIAKLDSNGEIIRNEEGLISDDYYRVMSDRLAGFEASELYVYGDYLYFASPCQEDEINDSGDMEWAKQRVDFYRIRLDRSGDVERIYRSQVYNSNLDYAYYEVNNNVYLLVHEQGESLNDDSAEPKSDVLTCVRVGGDTIEIATNVNSIVLKSDNSYNEIIYSTSVTESGETTTTLYKYDLSSNNSEQLINFDEDVDITEVTAGYIYITKEGRNEGELLRSSLDNINFTRVCYSGNKDNVFISPDANVVVAFTGGTFEFYLYGDSKASPITVTDSDAESITFVGFANGNMFYLDSSSNLKSISYSNVLFSQTPQISTILTFSSDANTTYFDLDQDYLYFYQTVGSNSYLHRIRINNNLGETEEMIGVYLEDDIPEEEETDETNETEESNA